MLNGNKENVSLVLHKKENNNKEEVIKYLCNKVNDLEEKLEVMNKNYLSLLERFEKLEKSKSTNFLWNSHPNI